MKILNLEQGSGDWLRFKAGKVSGTSLAQAIGSPKVQETLLNRLIAERMTETVNNDLNSEAVARGRELEPVALKAVIAASGIDFETIGMIAPDDLDNYAISPDAVKKENNVIVGGLEIKCPDSKKHVQYFRDNQVPKEYFHQVLSPFLCDESVQWWDFASFDDRNYELPLFIIRTHRKDIEEDISKAKTKLIDYLKRVDDEYYSLTF